MEQPLESAVSAESADAITNSVPAAVLLQLFNSIQIIEKSGSFERALRVAVDQLLRLVPGDAATIALLEPGRSWVRVVAGGQAGAAIEGYRLRPSEIRGLLEVALLDESTVTSDDCMADEYDEVFRIERLGRGVAIPLRRQGQVIGVMGLFRQIPQGSRFEPRECSLVEMFAGQVGPVLGAMHKIGELETAIKARDEFLSIASHDLRNPLTALRGFSQLTMRAINKIPADQPIPRDTVNTNLQRIVRQSNSLDELIGKLLDVSRINTGRLEIQPLLTNLAELVREATQRCAMAVATRETEQNIDPQQRHQLALELEHEEIYGQFDPSRMEQVVSNLIDNAVKYSPEGGTVRVSLGMDDNKTVVLRVSDQGMGIPEEKQSVIFNRWSRLYSTREGEIGQPAGLGLGLFICREIVRKHNGQITLESAPGQGTTFIVTLPLKS